MEPEEVIEEVKDSGLRGRGGAGFPTGMKWSFVPDETRQAEVPGLQRRRVGAGHVQGPPADGARPAPAARGVRDLLLRGRRRRPATSTSAASTLRRRGARGGDPARPTTAGFLGENILGSGFELDVYVHRGAGAYICGEETGMLESLEGKRGQPRVKPPFPAVVGAFGGPTVINNVETLACVPHILERGADWFKAHRHATSATPGPKLYAVSGHVERPGAYELPIGITFRELLDACGGMSPAAGSSRRSSRAAPRRRSSPPTRSTSRWTSTRWPRPARCSARRR